VTVERKIVFELNDIKAISFQCDKCTSRIAMSLDDLKELPKQCPNAHRWITGEQELTNVPTLMKFIETLRVLARQKALGFKILLEFDEPKVS
jgi:hypothetical protein